VAAFTLVEMLIVLAIIAILVSIVIISYSGWQQSTISTQLKSDLNNVASAMESARNFENSYPTSVPSTFLPSNGVTLSGGGINSGSDFCVDAKSDTQTYFITSKYKTPLPGPCPVLYLDIGINASYPGTGTALYDLSGNGRNGTLYNGVAYGSANGGFLSFDGVDDYVNFPSITLDKRNASVEIWLKHPGTPVANQGEGAIMIGQKTGIMTVRADGTISAATWNTAWTALRRVDTLDINDGSFHHLVMTLDSNYLSLYCDGEYIDHADTVTDFDMPDIGTSIKLGRRSATYEWNGSVAAAGIYNRALTADEVEHIFNSSHSRFDI